MPFDSNITTNSPPHPPPPTFTRRTPGSFRRDTSQMQSERGILTTRKSFFTVSFGASATVNRPNNSSTSSYVKSIYLDSQLQRERANAWLDRRLRSGSRWDAKTSPLASQRSKYTSVSPPQEQQRPQHPPKRMRSLASELYKTLIGPLETQGEHQPT
ncbi:uncharacterized protein RAG0_06440 [Rhynchosporium agropyri]|uniref:Uncharacterized protein n=1 Tax=Rhynchosporium agropyri TaxID=914238 RepID=A0A1E1KH36_9HELO|nr:uncharacterized protein RAG0_06440 [Rhynchosporium agropyri]